MKLTKEFQAEAKKQTNAYGLWCGMAAEDLTLAKIFRSQAEIDACAHVAKWKFVKFEETFRWSEEAREALVKLGIKEDY